MRVLLILALMGMALVSYSQNFTLQILHASDLEGGVRALESAPNFAAIVDALDDDYENSILLSAGDNYILGPFFSASGDQSLQLPLRKVYSEYFNIDKEQNGIEENNGRVDISIMNIIGFDASCLGNHEFDPGTAVLSSAISPHVEENNIKWTGTYFPYLSCNLDFSKDENLNYLYNSTIERADHYRFSSNTTGGVKRISNSTYVDFSGEKIGIVGVTTPLLKSISNPGETELISSMNRASDLASVIQPYVDKLSENGINKIILLSHLQQIQLEIALAAKLKDVDVIIAGGSDAILANEGQRLQAGDEKLVFDQYPVQLKDANSNDILVVSTKGEYAYVGRLVVDFDHQGHIVTSTIDKKLSGPVPTDDIMINQLYVSREKAFEENSKAYWIKYLVEEVKKVVMKKDANITGKSRVFLEGRKNMVRTEETNLGNLTADANLFVARKYDPEVEISIKNGGGIRSSIGELEYDGDDKYTPTPPQPNSLSGKKMYEISQLDIENSLRFNNELTIITITADNLKLLLEHAVDAWEKGAVPGSFPQIGGMSLIFNPDYPAGTKIRYLGLIDESGKLTEPVVIDGAVVGDPERTYKIVTLDFLADGGNNYPFESLQSSRVDLEDKEMEEGNFNFAPPWTEQDALAEYLLEKYSKEPYSKSETSPMEDKRIRNLRILSGN